MLITVLCTDPTHPVNRWLQQWIDDRTDCHLINLYRNLDELSGGDILFLVSCSQVVPADIRRRYRHTFVLHASDLPRGRGWSPHIWDLLSGADHITVTLLNAEDSVDTGAIWAKRVRAVPKYALYDEVNEILFNTELELMDEALRMIKKGERPVPQSASIKPTYYSKRTPEDSELDPALPLTQLFSKIRLMDPERYPAYFQVHGKRFYMVLKRGEE